MSLLSIKKKGDKMSISFLEKQSKRLYGKGWNALSVKEKKEIEKLAQACFN
jgi:hypothetical protein